MVDSGRINGKSAARDILKELIAYRASSAGHNPNCKVKNRMREISKKKIKLELDRARALFEWDAQKVAKTAMWAGQKCSNISGRRGMDEIVGLKMKLRGSKVSEEVKGSTQSLDKKQTHGWNGRGYMRHYSCFLVFFIGSFDTLRARTRLVTP